MTAHPFLLTPTDAGLLLRHLRLLQKQTTTALGAEAGIDQSVIVRVEQGRLRLNPDSLGRLLDALNTPPAHRKAIVLGMATDPGYLHLLDPTTP
ncbi:helix-turn-helix domain-containing protein [Nocardiopsis sp. CC223A]|uniref:helix-turn-helix domain-containing protein n=1 Tax=Nocardiopsis sp. CC223A TaxID=3044051 RepID=UPI00278C86E0|nr:helix-turn-helix transcriptional regulator [Nocardiopsis sp. CC223A]